MWRWSSNFVVDYSRVNSSELVGRGTHNYRRQTVIGFERIDYFAADGFAGRPAGVFRLRLANGWRVGQRGDIWRTASKAKPYAVCR